MKTCPCKDCKERSPACHGACKRFAEWKEPLEALKADREKNQLIDDTAIRGNFRRLGRRFKRNEI